LVDEKNKISKNKNEIKISSSLTFFLCVD